MTMTMTRRDALKKTVLSTALISAAALPDSVSAQAPAAPSGPFKLPPLPYPLDALEPHIDAKTMEIHHGRHHQAYVTNLNKAVAGNADLSKTSLEELIRHLEDVPEAVRTAVRNNGGGHYNHSLFWQTLKRGGGQPKGALAQALNKSFGSFDKFKEEFSGAAMKVFGSGWAWLLLEEKELKIVSTPNQDTPLSHSKQPLLGLDVWEHAYYLQYQNKRADYIAAFFNVINWDFVADRFSKA
jgi:superoxide dismutase, Fe-Mn family